jgi:ribonuclease VapC
VILDSSALVAVAFAEPDADRLLAAIASTPRLGIGAPTMVETAIVLSARLGRDARALVSRLVLEGDIALVPFTDAHYGTALDAWLQFGRGRHAASLNFGDCLAYATAKLAGAPLLCVGDDFERTDIEIATY